MPVDARGLSAHVLVDGRAVPELADPDATPRDWAFLRTAATNGQVSPEAAAACAQSKCLVATTAGTRFEVVVVNATRHHLCVDTFVDGSLSFRAPAPAGALHYWVATLQHLALRAAAPPECYAGGRVDGATRALQAAWRGALGRRRAARAHAASATLSRVRSRVAVGSAMPPPQPLRSPHKTRR